MSTAGKAPINNDEPYSLKQSRSTKSEAKTNPTPCRSTHSTKTAKKLKDPSSRDDTNGSSIKIIAKKKKKSKSTGTLGSLAVCVPPIPKKVAARIASGRTCNHELDSLKDAIKATLPAPDVITAEILAMLPEPRELVCSISTSFSLASHEMCLLYDHQGQQQFYCLRVSRPWPGLRFLLQCWHYLVLVRT